MNQPIEGVTGTVDFDGQSVTIIRSGMQARLNGGTGERRIPIGSISGVSWKPASGLSLGHIEFSVPGDDGWQGRPRNIIHKNHLAMAFTKNQQPYFEELRREIEQAMYRAREAQQQPYGQYAGPPQPPQDLRSQQLAQLHALWNQGVLSDEEYGNASQRLLTR